MEYLFTSLAVIFVGVVIFLSIRLRKSNQNIHQLQERYKSITNADQYIEKIKEESRIEINKKESALSEIEIKLSQVKESIIENEGKIIAAKERALQIIKEESQAIINEKQKILSGIELQITNIQNISKVDARKAIEDKEKSLQKLEDEINEVRKKIEEEIKVTSNQKQMALKNFERQINDIRSEYNAKRVHLENLINELSLYENQHEITSYGIYAPHFDFNTSDEYINSISKTREEEKLLVKEDRATHSSITWTVNGSEVEGRKQTKHYAKLMLRAFNGECEALIADVRWNNILKMEQRLLKSYEAINKLGDTHKINITAEYFKLKLSEIRLTYEYKEKIQAEKEEHRQIQEQIREEQRVQKEIDKALKESEDEEKRYSKALDQAKKELEKAQGEQLEKIREKVASLEKDLAEAREQKERALSMAQQTKAGHVYIISNIGAFGENIYKIGMTRRLEPMDRVKELGDASVPFEFDVHAMLFSEDAPALENKLHKEFHQKRVNLANTRKEFFNVNLEEIERIAKRHQHDVEFIKFAEARDYRESVSIRETWGSHQTSQPRIILEKIPVSI